MKPYTTMPRSKPSLILKCMRPYQWVKNALIFLPLILAHQMSDVSRVVAACLAFVTFSLAASAGYVFNDLLDREADRHHARKSTRPFASGELSPFIGVVLVFVLAGASLAISLIRLPPLFTVLLVVYLGLTLAYSLVLKSRLLVDVILLASLYTLRVVAGAFAVQVELTVWLLAFSTFFFLSLAFVKRYVELNMLRDAGEDATMRRRGYMVQDIDIIESVGPTSGYMAVLVLSLYINDQVAKRLYHNPGLLWLVCPILLYWITRVWFFAKRKALHDDPILFALRDRVSWIAMVLAAAMVYLATVDINWVQG